MTDFKIAKLQLEVVGLLIIMHEALHQSYTSIDGWMDGWKEGRRKAMLA